MWLVGAGFGCTFGGAAHIRERGLFAPAPSAGALGSAEEEVTRVTAGAVCFWLCPAFGGAAFLDEVCFWICPVLFGSVTLEAVLVDGSGAAAPVEEGTDSSWDAVGERRKFIRIKSCGLHHSCKKSFGEKIRLVREVFPNFGKTLTAGVVIRNVHDTVCPNQ